MTKDEMKKWIDNATYNELLFTWRTAPAGAPFFQREIGDYYAEVMKKKREEVGDAEHTRASKEIGWKH